VMSIDNMTEKELRAERDRLEALVNSEEATCADAIRLAEVRTSIKLINNVRNHRPAFPA